MAQRDNSQGFGFIYTDIKTLLSQREELKKWDEYEAPPENAKVVNFNQDPRTPAAPKPVERPATPSVEQIKENLDRLSKLHQKLHVILEEIETLNPKKKE